MKFYKPNTSHIHQFTFSQRVNSTRNTSQPFHLSHSNKSINQSNTNNNTINSETTTPYGYSPRPHKILKSQPNSYRTIIPSLQSSSSYGRNYPFNVSNHKSNVILNAGSPNHLLNYCKTSYKSKPIDMNKYNSFKLTYDDKEIEDKEKYKRQKKESEYTKYDVTTQIHSLPGGVKRGVLEKKRSNNKLFIGSTSMKVNSDYKSKIECLPTTMTIHNEDNKNRKEKNTFRKEKKTVGNINIYTESNPEYINRYVPTTNNQYGRNNNSNLIKKPSYNKTLNIETQPIRTGKKLYFGPNSPNHFKSTIVIE